MKNYNTITVDGNCVLLTDAEFDTLMQIERHMLGKNIPPTVRELCALCAVKSTSTMHVRLGNMADKGVIERLEDTSRGVVSKRIRYVRSKEDF